MGGPPDSIWRLNSRLLGVTVDVKNILPAEMLCESLDLRPGERVLDVASGDDATALAATRRFCDVTAIDSCPLLPFDDESFDVVTSTFGAMFAPDQQLAANELVRVCRRGGRIGMANWCPDGMIGDILRAGGKHVPLRPPRAAVEWGSATRLHELFGDRISSLRLQPRQFVWRFPTAAHALEYFRSYYLPTVTTFAALDAARQRTLSDALIAIFRKHDRSGDNTVVAPSDYVEAIAVRA